MSNFLPPEVLFEDADLIAVNKPAGLVSQATLDPRRLHLVSWIEKHLGIKASLQHRLDKDTSGVIILGKTKRVNGPLTDLFREHQMQKTYWALAKPKSDDTREDFQVDNHVAPVRDAKKKLLRMVEVKSGGWRATTDFRLLNRNAKFDWIEARPLTGRTHQIRIHLAGLKRPIWGDFLYGGKTDQFPRLMLHARELKMLHPITKQELRIEAPVPKDFESFLKTQGQ